jgi:hypothetical protein
MHSYPDSPESDHSTITKSPWRPPSWPAPSEARKLWRDVTGTILFSSPLVRQAEQGPRDPKLETAAIAARLCNRASQHAAASALVPATGAIFGPRDGWARRDRVCPEGIVSRRARWWLLLWPSRRAPTTAARFSIRPKGGARRRSARAPARSQERKRHAFALSLRVRRSASSWPLLLPGTGERRPPAARSAVGRHPYLCIRVLSGLRAESVSGTLDVSATLAVFPFELGERSWLLALS